MGLDPMVFVFLMLRFTRGIVWGGRREEGSGWGPREFHRLRRLAGYSPWGRKESDTTEAANTHLNF